MLLIAAALAAGSAPPGPRSPEAALRALQVRPGFVVEQVAAEPLVQDPIAFDWGPDGKLWVVEMGDYPLGLDNKGKPGGRIRVLEDTDGDGRYEKATTFLDKLLHPTGVKTWRKGVLITCAPEIFFAEDTDGDGRADRRDVLFLGFGEVNPQHRVNGLRWGLDNWIYCANGDFAPSRDHIAIPAGGPPRGTPFHRDEDVQRLMFSGAAIQSTKTGATFDIRNRDFRFRPEEGRLDPQSGQSQFGRDRDDWGNWFGCDHAMPMWHFVLADEYLRRNPFVATPRPRVESPALTFPAAMTGRDSGTVRRAQGNAFTSGCGITVYRDELFGPEFTQNWFVCEPVHNLVHREVLVPSGVTFSSHRAADEPRSEFLASDDTWFSPVMVRTGPDGALWVADMYRQVLEHPNWLPPGWEQRNDVRAGHDRGRIYRVYPAGKAPRPIPRLDRLGTPGLVAALDSPNGWQRDMAQQLLVERRDQAAIPLLERQARTSRRALCRLHSLCTLDGLSALRPEVLQPALEDPEPGVRRHAVRLCESKRAQAPDLGAVVAKLVHDPDPPVRLQVAYSLGAWDDPRVGQALGQLMLKDARDAYISAATMSSVTKTNLGAILETVLADTREGRPALLWENLLRTSVGLGDTSAVVALLGRIAAPAAQGRFAAWQFEALAGWLDALDQRNTPLATLETEGSADLHAGLNRLAGLFAAARITAHDPQAARAERLLALRLLGRGLDHQQDDLQALADLIVPQVAAEVQAAAVDGLGRLNDPRVADVLLRGWKGHAPGLRARILDVLYRRQEWLAAVLDALEHQQILSPEIDSIRRQRLLEHLSAAVRARAAKVFAGLIDPNRQKVVEAYQSALALKGDPDRGRQVFVKTCAACHRGGGVGQEVGPDLSMTREKPPEWFLPALFDPSQAVDAKYINYVAATRDGAIFSGVLSQESGQSITLIGPTGQTQVVLRTNLDELASTGKSAMPEGLENELRPQDVADLIAFLRSGSPPRE
jgi:putative membrane-bound dehydrogenase-like protein